MVRRVVVFGEDALAVDIEDEEGGDGVEGEVGLVWVSIGKGRRGGRGCGVVTDSSYAVCLERGTKVRYWSDS